MPREAPDWVWQTLGAGPWARHARRASWRAAEFERVEGLCPGCGRAMHEGGRWDDALCTVDHVVPRSRGGEDVEANWAVLCRRCNADKGDYLADDRD